MDRLNTWITAAVVAIGLCATVPSARAAEMSKGAKMFVKNRCTTCHSVKAVGIEKKAGEAAKSPELEKLEKEIAERKGEKK